MKDPDRFTQAEVEKAACSAMDNHSQALPEETRSSLAQARSKALQSPRKSGIRIGGYPMPRASLYLGGAIAASITAVSLNLGLHQAEITPVPENNFLPALTEVGELDETEWALIQDLEFALWLAEVNIDE